VNFLGASWCRLDSSKRQRSLADGDAVASRTPRFADSNSLTPRSAMIPASLLSAGLASLVTGWLGTAHLATPQPSAPLKPPSPCGRCEPTISVTGTCGLPAAPIVNFGSTFIQCVSDGICFPASGVCKASMGVRFSVPAGAGSLRTGGGCLPAPGPGLGWQINMSLSGGCGDSLSEQVQICAGACAPLVGGALPPCVPICTSTVKIRCTTCLEIDV
jgi:hypothetical protein